MFVRLLIRLSDYQCFRVCAGLNGWVCLNAPNTYLKAQVLLSKCISPKSILHFVLRSSVGYDANSNGVNQAGITRGGSSRPD